jgi:hypothetical protein
MPKGISPPRHQDTKKTLLKSERTMRKNFFGPVFYFWESSIRFNLVSWCLGGGWGVLS